MGEVCSIYEKYNIELIAEGFEHEATMMTSVFLKSVGEVYSTYEKYNIELIVEGSGHEAFRCEF